MGKIAFLKYQISCIKEGGLRIFIQKTGIFFWILILSILAVPAVIVIRILRPLIILRLGQFDIGRFGAIINADWYLSGFVSENHKKNIVDIFYFVKSTNSISNKQLLKMWTRALRVFPFWQYAHVTDKVNRLIPGYEHHVVPLLSTFDLLSNNGIKHILDNRETNFSFTPKEELHGKELLQQLGIPGNAPFICFHARDSAYLNSVSSKTDWSYHDYRDSSINNYLLAVEYLAREGYYLIRMGSVVREKLESENQFIIDYASNGKRTEFMDIYLSAKCKFFLGSNAGTTSIPEIFRKPVVYVNWIQIHGLSPWVLNGLFIFKKFYLRKEERSLTFREIINLGLGMASDTKQYEQLGVELIENTPEEIRAVAIEMENRLNGTWKEEKEDEYLQQRFWTLCGPDKLRSSDLRIGAEFLRQNQELLE